MNARFFAAVLFGARRRRVVRRFAVFLAGRRFAARRFARRAVVVFFRRFGEARRVFRFADFLFRFFAAMGSSFVRAISPFIRRAP